MDNKELRVNITENLKSDIGLHIEFKGNEIDGFEFFYEDKNVNIKPVYLHQSIRDRNHFEDMGINHHEFILYYYLQINVPNDQINFVISNIETGSVAYFQN